MTKNDGRPECIRNWHEMLGEDNCRYEGSDELLSFGAPMGKLLGLKRLGIHYEILPPGRRTSWPHAEKTEEEFIFVLKGRPHAWINGELHALVPGDAVSFPAGTGVLHTFINNSEEEAHLIVIGEQTREDNQIHYAFHQERNDHFRKKGVHWDDIPPQKMGDHDGLPDRLRKK